MAAPSAIKVHVNLDESSVLRETAVHILLGEASSTWSADVSGSLWFYGRPEAHQEKSSLDEVPETRWEGRAGTTGQRVCDAAQGWEGEKLGLVRAGAGATERHRETAEGEERSCGAPSLEALKARLDGALGSLSWWGAALPTAGVGAGWALSSLPIQTILWFYERFYERIAM